METVHTHPQTPIKAVTHPDPYPYYRKLVEERPFAFDETLGMWVAASAEAVREVLTSSLCRVRPVDEPVPAALINSRAGDIFASLVRMNDGQKHEHMKQAVSAMLSGMDESRVRQSGNQWAERLFRELRPDQDVGRLSELGFRLPMYVIGDLLGIPHERLPQVAEWIGEFVRCLSPLGSTDQVEQGKAAAGHLLDLADSLHSQGLFGRLRSEVGQIDPASLERVSANGIGFLSQTYEATAGLFGNTLVTLARRKDVLDQVKYDPNLLPDVIYEVMRTDPSVHNTRRYVAESGVIAGQAMQTGDAILVILAAANYDPAANPDPERFDPHRTSRQVFTFGVGPHACPGMALAAAIVQAGVMQWIRSGADCAQLLDGLTYRESVNVRVPLFARSTF